MEESENGTRLPIPWGAVIYAAIILAAIGTVLLIRAIVIEPFSIPTESMCDTLQVGDSVLAEKITLELGGTVSTGDVIVFENPEKGSEKDVLCKRVIARAGVGQGPRIRHREELPLPLLHADEPWRV